MSNFKNWKEVKKEIESDFTPEEIEEMELEKQIILATIEARKKSKYDTTRIKQKNRDSTAINC